MGGSVPLGYDPDGRTLRINKAEAKTIQTLYDLYEQHGTVRAVKEQADALGLRSRQRTSRSGNRTGGKPFDRGHIHHILTNPIYAGCIRHRDKVFEGQHDAIIDPERWDHVQAQLQEGAAKGRVRKTAKQRSLLCSKLFDETGDRLTPSHTKTRKGVRLRYYISHRLVAKSGEKHKDAWRLPAPELEEKAAGVATEMMSAHGFAAKLLMDPDASKVADATEALKNIAKNKGTNAVLKLIVRINIAPDDLVVHLSADVIAALIKADPQHLDETKLSKRVPFQLRKRGVETKIILADGPTSIDETLINNIAKAQVWFERIKAGETFTQIAKTGATSKRRIQQMIDLAFLAPDVIRDVLEGKQPIGFTSDW